MKKRVENSDLNTEKDLPNLHGSFSEKEEIAGIPRYFSIAQVAVILQVSTDYVRTLVKNGYLESVKLPGGPASPVRIPAASLHVLINSSKASCQHLEQAPSKRKRKQKPYYGVFSV